MADDLPRLLYVGDIQVETSYHSSVQLYRLLEHYPPHRLLVIETREPPSRAERRLPGVTYASFPLAHRRWLRSRLGDLYSAWLAWRAPARAGHVLPLIADFHPDAVVTVGSGFGWIVAAELARRIGVPLHLIAHDDWPKPSRMDRVFKKWLQRRFADVYRRAQSRLCVSPFMLEEFERRYGVAGSLLYPSRSDDCPVFEAKPPRVLGEADEIVVGYCGGSGSHVLAGLKELASAVAGVNARVVLFGPFDESKRRDLLAISPACEFHGFVAYEAMMAGLRSNADVLFVPMTFDAAERDNMTVSFPSKLVDYTALGLPILVQAPPYSSAVRWAKLHEPVAAVVEMAGPAGVGAALRRLKGDAVRRRLLSERALEVGAVCFASGSGRDRFHAALKCSITGTT